VEICPRLYKVAGFLLFGFYEITSARSMAWLTQRPERPGSGVFIDQAYARKPLRIFRHQSAPPFCRSRHNAPARWQDTKDLPRWGLGLKNHQPHCFLASIMANARLVPQAAQRLQLPGSAGFVSPQQVKRPLLE